MTPLEVTIKPGPRRLELGHVLLDPNAGDPRIWTVTRTTTINVELATHHAGELAIGRLKGTALPDGWRILDAPTILDALDALDFARADTPAAHRALAGADLTPAEADGLTRPARAAVMPERPADPDDA